jgi:predicted RNase H-like HicB family nuclease
MREVSLSEHLEAQAREAEHQEGLRRAIDMQLKIKTTKLEDGDYLAQADPSFKFVVGFPGAVSYGDTEAKAYANLKSLLEGKGHQVIE